MDTPADGQVASFTRYVIEVVAPTMDVDRLRVLMSGAFGARSARIRSSVPLMTKSPPQRARLSPLGERIMATLADGRPWRSKHLIAHVAEARKAGTVRQELDCLWDEGRISKPRSGIWMLSGMPEPAPEDIPPLRAERVAGPTGRRVLAHLQRPTAAAALVSALGVSRQRVDQILKMLLKDTKVIRVREPGTAGRWLWMRNDINVRESLRNHMPTLVHGRASVLNTLEPDAFHWISSVATMTGQSPITVNNNVQELEARGLVVSVRMGQRRYVGITPRGLEHPMRAHDSAKAVIADLSKAFGEKRIAFLQALSVLGEARTVDVTAALAGAERSGKELSSGQLSQRMVESGLAEPIVSDHPGHSLYRVTEAGKLAAALVARTRKPASREELELQIQLFRDRRTARLRNAGFRSGKAGPVAGSRAQQAILDALVHGPLATPELRKTLASHVKNTKSAHLMLRTLADRGAIHCVGTQGTAKIWALGMDREDSL